MTNVIAEQRVETVKPETVKHGDTIYLDGKLTSISREDIKTCLVMGTTICGKRLDTVTRKLFPKWYKGGIIGYRTQIN